jgi:hypothetical protein
MLKNGNNMERHNQLILIDIFVGLLNLVLGLNSLKTYFIMGHLASSWTLVSAITSLGAAIFLFSVAYIVYINNKPENR